MAQVLHEFTQLSSGHLFVIGIAISCVVFVIIFNGIHFKWGDKEIDIGGLRKQIVNKEYDEDIRFDLHKFMADIDKYMYADIRSYIEDIEKDILTLHKGKCYFPMTRLAGIIKQEFYKKVNYNDLKTKLSLQQKETYVRELKKEIKESYQLFQKFTVETICNDTYPEWQAIEDEVNKRIDTLINRIIAAIVVRIGEKITEYRRVEGEFKVKKLKLKYCSQKIEDNKKYLHALGAIV